MAQNIFGFGPMGAMKPESQQSAPVDDAATKRVRLEGIATKTQIPANVLMALDEAGERDIEGFATRLAAETKAGRKVEEILPPQLMNRAYDIADAIYPKQAAPAPAPDPNRSVAGDLLKQVGGSVVRGLGGTVEAAGLAAEEFATGGRGIPADQSETWARKGGRWLGDHIRNYGQNMQSGVSPQAKAALQASTPDGDIFDPSTWSFGKSPSLEGYAMLGADVLGSLLPVVATAVITKSPTAAAMVGGGMGGGAGMETARDIVTQAANTKLPDGRSALEANSAFYRDLIASGMSPELALERTTRAAERVAGLMTAPVSAFGGAATAKILTQPVKPLASRGLGARIAGTAALSGLEEGVQEVAESIATRKGVEAGIGLDQNLTEGTFGDFILGAMGGAVPGAASGALSRREEGPILPQQQPGGGDGSAVAGQDIGPNMAPPGDMGPVSDNSMGVPPGQPPAPPAGPIERAAAVAPDLTPVPEVEPVEVPPMFPDQKPGSAVRLMDPETGEIIEGVFQREEGGNAIVRIGGEEVDIAPQFFDEMLGGARQADLEAEAAAKGGKGAKTPAVKPVDNSRVSQVDSGGMTLVHGGETGLRLSDIQIIRDPASQKQGKKGRVYGGFYATSEADADYAEGYAKTQADGGLTYDLKLKPDTKILNHDGDITRLSEKQINEWVTQGIGVVVGKDPRGKVEYAVIDKNAIDDFSPRRMPLPPATPSPAADASQFSEVQIKAEIDDIRILNQDFGMTSTEEEMRNEAIETLRRRGVQPDGGAGVEPVAPVQGGVTAGSGPDQVAPLETGPVPSAPMESGGEGLAGTVAGAEPGKALTPPRPQTSPITTAPGDRIQPDMLGGEATNEAAMASKERRRKEWGRVLGIASNQSTSDESIEGRDILIRPSKIVIRAQNGKRSDLDFTIDTEGMDRDAIATAIRGGLQTLDRVAPLPVPEPATKPDAGATDAARTLRQAADDMGAPTEKADQIVQSTLRDWAADAETNPGGASWATLTIVASRLAPRYPDIANRVEAVAKDMEAKEKGSTATDNPAKKSDKSTWADFDESSDNDPKMPNGYDLTTVKRMTKAEASARGYGWPSYMAVVVRDKPYTYSSASGYSEVSRTEAVTRALKSAQKGVVEPAVPTRAEIDAAASETAVDPTPAQAEAENYKTGKIDWRGVTLSIENAKGSIRSKMTPDGKTAWKVTMPADYGRILGTKGADGDHVDFYMGPNPEADTVYVIDQVDADTRDFDEHKVMIGFKSQADAVNTYGDGFSDGRGLDRIGAVTPMQADALVKNLKNGRWDGPWSRDLVEDLRAKGKKAFPDDKPAKPAKAEPKTPGAARPYPDFNGKLDGIYEDNRSEDGRFNETRLAFHDATSTFLKATVKILKDGGWTEAKGRDGKPIKPVDVQKGNSSNIGDVTMTMAGPTGERGIYIKFGDGMSQRNGVRVMWRINQASNVYGSGQNQFLDPTGMTPADLAAKIIEAHDRITASPAPAAQPAPAPKPEPSPLVDLDFIMQRVRGSLSEFEASDVPHVVGMGRLGEFLIGIGKKRLEPLSDNARTLDIGNNMIGGPEPIVDLIRERLGDDLAALAMKAYDDGVSKAERDAQSDPEQAPEPLLKSGVKNASEVGQNSSGGRQNSSGGRQNSSGGRQNSSDQTKSSTYETQPKVQKPGLLSVLSQEKQDRAAFLQAKLAAKARNQTSSGLDPEYITLGGELVALYIEAGTKRFAQMLRDFAESTGLTMREAQAPMRAAYNYVRDDMDLNGEDITGMDTSEQVMAEVRKALAAEATAKPSPKTEDRGNVAAEPEQEGGANVNRLGPDSNPRDAGGQPETVSPDVGSGSGDASRPGDLPSGETGSQAEPGRNNAGMEDAGRTRSGTGPSGRSGIDGAGDRPRNYRIPRGGLNDTRGEKTRAKDSVEAIRLLKQIEAQGRRATAEEQKKLALYAGAGSLNPAVPNSDGSVRSGWESLAADLTSLVSKEEMDTIARTTQYAFYTSEEIVRGMWAAVERLGFRGGNVFEPGMGVGHFLGMSPDAMQGRMTYRGVELDSITARIARQLYPEATVTNQDFTRVEMPRDYFDLAIGNPPFANIEIKADKKYPQKFLLHDYFFAKTLDSVRPGGLLVFVTSEGTMNKMDADARLYLAERADLVGAIRLPNTAFKGSAGTEVTTDVIVLRKRAEAEPAGDQTWLGVDMVPLPGLEGARSTEFKVNRYFVQNPDMILGKQGGFGTQRFRGQYAVVPNEGENLATAFAAAVQRLPADVMTDPAFDPTRAPEAVDPESGQVKAGSFYIKDGALWQYDGSVGRKVKRRGGGEGGTMTAGDYEKAIQFVAIRDALRDVYAADLSDDRKAADVARKALNEAYDTFVKKHGPINRAKTQFRRPNGLAMERARAIQREEALEQGKVWDEGSFDPTPYIDATMVEDSSDDPDAPSGPLLGAPREAATKRYTWAQIARMRKEAMEAAGPSYRDGSFDPDAVADIEIVKRENLAAFIDDPEVWRLSALEKYDTDTDTGTKTKVFSESVLARQEEPKISNAKDGLNYVMGLRGYPDIALIAEKADMAMDAVIEELAGLIFLNPSTGRWENRDTYLSGNVRKKLKVARDIGTPELARNIAELEKVMPRDLTEYEVTATLGMPWIPRKEVQNFAKSIGMTVVVERAKAGGKWSVAGEKSGTDATVTWGTDDRPFPALLESVLNRTVIKITRTSRDADGKETTTLDEAATQAANEKADAIRTAFSQWVWADDARKESLLRIYNDRFNSTVAPTFDGSYLTTPGIAKGWSWRPHQLRAIARILQSGSTYLAHAVGAGKTSEMIAAAMEARRLGIARKPMFTVPNHMLGQFATEFYEHYPNANILVADDRRFHTDRRRQFIADAAANDYDAIILTHSSFQKVAVSDALNDEFVQSEIERFDEAIRVSRDNGDRITTKEMERAKEKLEQRLRGNQTDKSRVDAQMTFEELGVDMLFVDEAHLFRKLDFATQLGSLKGITPSGSKMAWDLFLKTRHLERVNPGRGIVLASGTPITNTMAELHTISRYIQHDTLEDQGLLDFDSWAQSYGETAIDYEPDAAGNYKAVSRFSRFVNTRDLSLMVRERMDTVIPEDLEKYVVRPKLRGGGRTPVPVPRSPAVEAYQGELASRMKAIEERKSPPQKGDDNHLVVIGDGIAAATDMRLIDNSLSGRDSKLTRLADNLLKIWKATADTPFYKPDSANRKFSDEPVMRGPAAQMVFADIQRRPGKSPFDTHEFIRDHLIRNGVPAEQIALFRDFKNTEAKRRLFRRVNDGEVRVLIGSAKAMGTGVNAQKRLIAMHNLDPHWYPALDEQRVGRILRQGNWNPEIQVFDYATEGTYDSTMWQMMGRKARTIEDFLRGDPNINEMEDVGPASVFEQLAGMTTPDPRILRLKELQEEVKKLGRRRANLAGERRSLVNRIDQANASIKWAVREAESWEAVADKYVDLRGDGFKAKVGNAEFTDRAEFGEALNAAAQAWADARMGWPNTKIGEVNGSAIMIGETPKNGYSPSAIGLEIVDGEDLAGEAKTSVVSANITIPFSKAAEASVSLYSNPVDTAKAVSRAVQSIPERAEYYRDQEAEIRKDLAQAEAALANFKGFTEGPVLAAKEEELAALVAMLDAEEEVRQGRGAKPDPAAKPTAPSAPRRKKTFDMRMDDDGGPAYAEMREDAPPVATLTGKELGRWEDIRQLGKKAEAWYRNNLVGQTIVNSATGMAVQFRREGGRKVSGRKGDVLMRIVPALREIIANGTLTNTEADTKGNRDVRAWHTISATVMLEGKPRDVVVKVKETADGSFHYDLSRDMSDGARQMVASGRDGDTAIGLEDNPVSLNLQFSSAEINADDAPITDDDMRGITRDMNAELGASGLAGKVSVRVVRNLVSFVTGDQIQGRFNEGARNIEVKAGATAGPRGVMRHEIIHALRAEELWGKPFGLFTGAEWRGLAQAARGEPEIVASVKERYPKLDAAGQTEEMVAELYRLWSAQRDGYDGVSKSLAKVEAFLQAMANMLRGRGFGSAALTMERIAGGKVGGRGPQGPGGRGKNSRPQGDAEMRAIPGTVRDKFKGLVGFRNWKDAPSIVSEAIRNATTDRITTPGPSLLALVPGRPLFAEMGKSLLSARRYLRTKEEMDTLRNDWQSKAAEVSNKWMEMHKKDAAANDALMDLMHRSTMTGVDPSRPDPWGDNDNLLKSAQKEWSRLGTNAPLWAKQKLSDFKKRQQTYATVKQMFDALPPEYQAFYVEVKNSYEELANDFDKALEDNIKNAAKIALKRQERIHRKEERRIKDEGLTGQDRVDAIEANDKALAKAKKRAMMGVNTRIKSLRKTFEGQRLKGPYFPLARFGNYFVTVRDAKGEVVNFSRFENEASQQTFVREQEAIYPGGVRFGLLEDKGAIRDQIPPQFVADVEMMLADTGASPELMDAIWQRYLESLPDQSIRTSKIHRKGRAGFNRDALRSYTSHTFHGAHQLARLKFGIELQDSLDDAMEEARRSDDPNRATALVNEMRKRMNWTMNPTGSAMSAAASSFAFVWYLGVSPAAALVNLTQTTVIGPGMMKARFKSASLGKITTELGKAAKDFAKGRGQSWNDTWSAENSPDITPDELAALKEGYRRGTIDKSQAHDLASVAESGVEFNPWREKWMRRFGFAFHHAERVNREVTFLANYRLAKADGQSHGDAIETAADLTWQIHFSYQNSDRPRFMQNDYAKVIFIFRQFSTNLLYRLFRDAHQSLNGKSKAERDEARTQLIGISLSMMAHAGIKGVWGYSLIMGLLSLFFPGDSDDLEEWMQDALLMEGDSVGVAAWNYAMGAALNGVPGQITGAALTERIGLPDLWFRGSDRDLEGRDAVQQFFNELAGPIGGIAYSLLGSGIPGILKSVDVDIANLDVDVDGSELARGIEASVPKFVRDLIKTGRYAVEGVQTRNDDSLIENVNPWELLLQANGFTPARVAERYDINTRLKNKEKEITDERKGLHRKAGDYMRKGQPIPASVMDDISDFNKRVPEYPITGKTLRQSVQGRIRASDRNEFGVAINPKINDRLRGALAPSIYN